MWESFMLLNQVNLKIINNMGANKRIKYQWLELCMENNLNQGKV
jgi:hypothetical protein